MTKLLNLKQKTLPMQDFLKNLEDLAEKAFPEPEMAVARKKCVISALTTNCRNKSLAFQIYSFVKSTAKPSLNEIILKAVELDSLLGCMKKIKMIVLVSLT